MADEETDVTRMKWLAATAEAAPDDELDIEELGPVKTLELNEGNVLSVDAKKRVMRLRVVRYNEVVEHPEYGRMLFMPGAFVPPDPATVRLRLEHQNPPTGKGIAYEDKADAPYLDVRVSKTARGDEQLTLAVDGVSRGTSPGFRDVPGKPRQMMVGGHLTTVYPPASAVLAEVSTTWMPTFEGDGVVHVLSKQDEKGDGPVSEAQEAPVSGAPTITAGIDYDAMAKATAGAVTAALANERDAAASEAKIDAMLAKFDNLIELQRSQYTVPAGEQKQKPKLHHWVEYALRRMRGDVMSPTELKTLALDDVVTTEQPGLVPTQFSPDYDDLIDQDRPFLNSTRRIEPPATGTSMVLPIITTRAVAGTQAGDAEKGALTTTATKVGTGTFAYKSVFGGADISIQFINRAERGFFELLTGDMAMAYALDCENKAIDALLAGYTDSATVAHAPVDGGTLDPEDLNLGAAWQTSITAYKRAPDTIWLSSAAVAAFIDAKISTTNMGPMYSNLAGAFTAASGTGGVLSGLRPIYVPALDDEDVDIIVGPARGFVWAEDPARELRADVPEKAGRDIALAGGLFPAPRFAHAFTTYVLAGS